MILHQSYRQDLIDNILELPDEVFDHKGKVQSKSELLNDRDTIDHLWYLYQKNIEDYDMLPGPALVEACKDSLHIDINEEKREHDTEDAAKQTPPPKVVYIAAPYAAPTELEVQANVRFHEDAMFYAINQNCIPLATALLYPPIMTDTEPAERAYGIALGMQMLARCDELWYFSENGVSPGMQQEIDLANQLGIPVIEIKDTSNFSVFQVQQNIRSKLQLPPEYPTEVMHK